MLFNDFLVLALLILLSVLFYISNNNIMMLLYTGGLYLILVGIFCLLNDADIYIGFLWVIDLGVGLIFFIFIVHFTSFLHQKAFFNLSARHFFSMYVFVVFIIKYKGFKYKYNLKGDICRLFFVRSRKKLSYVDGSFINFSDNSGIRIKKKQDPKSKFLNGPISRRILRRKVLSLFKVSI